MSKRNYFLLTILENINTLDFLYQNEKLIE